MAIGLRRKRYQPEMGDRVVIKQVADKSMRSMLGRTAKVVGFDGVYVVLVRFDDNTTHELHAHDVLVEKVES